jgi:cell division protein ZapA
MQNRVTVTLGGQEYTLLAVEGEDYVRRMADIVNEKLAQTAAGSQMARVDCALLTAMNLADEKTKEQEAAENLRRQIKELLEESAKLKLELSEAKREIFKLQQKR